MTASNNTSSNILRLNIDLMPILTMIFTIIDVKSDVVAHTGHDIRV